VPWPSRNTGLKDARNMKMALVSEMKKQKHILAYPNINAKKIQIMNANDMDMAMKNYNDDLQLKK
jgi:hypothetical protein